MLVIEYLLNLALWLSEGSVSAKVPRIPRKNAYSLIVGYIGMTTCAFLPASCWSFLVATRVCLAIPVY